MHICIYVYRTIRMAQEVANILIFPLFECLTHACTHAHAHTHINTYTHTHTRRTATGNNEIAEGSPSFEDTHQMIQALVQGLSPSAWNPKYLKRLGLRAKEAEGGGEAGEGGIYICIYSLFLSLSLSRSLSLSLALSLSLSLL